MGNALTHWHPHTPIRKDVHDLHYVHKLSRSQHLAAWRRAGTRAVARTLTWIWLHPFIRRQNWLTHSWPPFRKHFGDRFSVLRPWSEAMASFLGKQGHWQIRDADIPW